MFLIRIWSAERKPTIRNEHDLKQKKEKSKGTFRTLDRGKQQEEKEADKREERKKHLCNLSASEGEREMVKEKKDKETAGSNSPVSASDPGPRRLEDVNG